VVRVNQFNEHFVRTGGKPLQDDWYTTASAHTHEASSSLTCMCPMRGETARAFGPNTGTMCRFSAQYWIIATPREASGSASGGSMTIFAGGSLVVSGITGAGRQLSLALCAIAVVAHNTIAATDSRDMPFGLAYFGFSMFFPPCVHLNRKSDLLNASVNQHNHLSLKA